MKLYADQTKGKKREREKIENAKGIKLWHNKD